MKLKKNDYVQVMTGKDAGKKGRIMGVNPDTGRALVEGVNYVKRHTKPGRVDRQGGIVQKEMPVDVSNLQYYCLKCNKPARVGFRFVSDNKVRICKKCGEPVENTG